MASVKKHKIKLREVNRHLVCRLCRGYYVDATTIAECLHSFCRSCIITYLEKNSFCPICEVQIHETKPHLNLRLDKTLQDVVYKLVPGLYHNEMKRRREFYAKHPEQVPLVTPEQCGLEERLIFSPEDSISLSLEYLESQDYETDSISSRSSESGGDNQDGLSFPQQLGLMKLKNEGKNSRRESQDVQDPASHPKRYLQCPANVNISHLKKFIKMKFYLTDKEQVDIIHKRVPLPDHYTLMDVAYIYTWKRSAPMRFFFQINEVKKEEKMKVSLTTVKSDSEPQQQIKQQVIVANSEKPKPISEEATQPNCNGDRDLACPTQNSDKTEKTEINLDKSNNNNNNIRTDKTEPSAKPVEKIEENVNEKATEDAKPLEEKPQENKICDSKPNEEVKEKKEEKTETKEEGKDDKNESKDKVLLNPYSGKLETVPLEKQTEIKEQKEKPNDSKKSNVNSLKNFRREKSTPNRDNKVQLKVASGDSLTITTTTKREKPLEKEEANVSIEIKRENKGSEYDFDSTSPPSKISMSLKEYTKSEQFKSISKIVKTPDVRNQNGGEEKKEKPKAVPSLYRINTEQNKKSVQKTPNGKVEAKPEEKKVPSPTVINIKTESQKSEIKIEAPEKILPPKPIKLESVEVKKPEKQTNGNGTKKIDTLSPEQTRESLKGLLKRFNTATDKDQNSKKIKMDEDKKKNDFGAIDLSKPEGNVKHEKNPLENLAEMAKKTNGSMVEMLITAAQNQSIEPLLKIPQYFKYPPQQISPTQGKNFAPAEVNQALQFYTNLKNQSQSIHALHYLQQQSMLEAQKRLKRQQMDSAPQRKQLKLSPNSEARTSPTSDPKTKSPPKSSPSKEDLLKIERTVSQIKDYQQRMLIANYNKNLPHLFQYRQPPIHRPGAASPTKTNQKSSHSPNSQKSPHGPLVPTTSSSNVFDPLTFSEDYARALSANTNKSFNEVFEGFLSSINSINSRVSHLQQGEKDQKSVKRDKDVFQSEGKKPTGHSPPIATSQKT